METPSTPSDNAAPVPWLGASGDSATRQAWSRGGLPGVVLVARYDFHADEFRRYLLRLLTVCSLRVVITAVGYSVAQSLFVVGVGYLLLVLTTNHHPSFGKMLGANMAGLLSINVPIALAVAVLLLTGVLVLSFIKKWSLDKPPTVLMADSEGIGYQRPNGKRQTLKWSKVGRVENRNGDVFVLPRWLGAAFYAPRSAFVDNAQATRFADALTALWKANGNPALLDPAALSEFRG